MVMQEDARAALKDNRKLANRWNNMNLGNDGASAATSNGEDMGDMIAGDQKIIHHHYPPPTTPTTTKSKIGTLGKLALAGGLLATGVGTGFAIPLAISALKDWKQPAPVVQPTPTPSTDTDTDTTGEIMLWPPKAK